LARQLRDAAASISLAHRETMHVQTGFRPRICARREAKGRGQGLAIAIHGLTHGLTPSGPPLTRRPSLEQTAGAANDRLPAAQDSEQIAAVAAGLHPREQQEGAFGVGPGR
jgi:hypothetical protein